MLRGLISRRRVFRAAETLGCEDLLRSMEQGPLCETLLDTNTPTMLWGLICCRRVFRAVETLGCLG